MTAAELLALVLVLLIFGGASGLFTFIAIRLMLDRLRERGVFVRFWWM